MQLGINGRRLIGERTGVGRYIEYLLREWNNMICPFQRITLYTHEQFEEKDLDLSSVFVNRVLRTKLPALIWENVILPRSLNGIDLLLCPSYTAPVAYNRKCVVIIHGVQEAIQKSFPWWSLFRYTPFYVYSAWKATRIIAVSESAKKDIMKYYRVPGRRIKVVYNGVDEIFHPIEDEPLLDGIREKFMIGSEPFILFVGKLSKRRHIPDLLIAFGQLKRRHNVPHKIVLVGPNHLKMDIKRIAREAKVEDSMIHIDYTNHRNLSLLYNAAELFIYPSEYEGFGLPVLEAMACGTPVITLKRSALSEIADGYAFMMTSCSTKSLSEAMYTVISDGNLRHKLIEKGLERAKCFSWKKTAEETMAILESVAKG